MPLTDAFQTMLAGTKWCVGPALGLPAVALAKAGSPGQFSLGERSADKRRPLRQLHEAGRGQTLAECKLTRDDQEPPGSSYSGRGGAVGAGDAAWTLNPSTMMLGRSPRVSACSTSVRRRRVSPGSSVK